MESNLEKSERQRNGKISVKSQTNLLQDILEHITTVVHVLSFGLTVYVLYLCFLNRPSLVGWHVLLYTLGWTLLMTEGILAIFKENIISKRLKQADKVRLHWVTLALATELIIGGLGTIIYNRARGDGNHFSTEHGLSGIVATIAAFVTVLNGIPALYSAALRKLIPPNVNKFFHTFLAIATLVSGAYATITGYYTGWFRNRSTPNMIIVCFAMTVVITVWSGVKPIINGFNRIRNMIN